ncbi:hypothetical protein Q5P01_007493 [Channa striata]|uniref:Uncharacterized protein n=1 Tax=Channa striata TaxID=64152 RepID=A0AA88SYP0_CHASR|nr:hypothetical protein Q5P01_007493 [Channa striata]
MTDPAAKGPNLGASSCVFSWPRPLSMVLEPPPRPRERQSLWESCANIHCSLPFKLSAISKYWLTFARQPRKPIWKSENSDAATVPGSKGMTSYGAVRHRGESRAAPCPRSLASRFSTLLTERGEGLGKLYQLKQCIDHRLSEGQRGDWKP